MECSPSNRDRCYEICKEYPKPQEKTNIQGRRICCIDTKSFCCTIIKVTCTPNTRRVQSDSNKNVAQVGRLILVPPWHTEIHMP